MSRRPRLARLQDLAAGMRASVRRRRDTTASLPDRRTSEELERRLDETRERLRREIPPPNDEPAG